MQKTHYPIRAIIFALSLFVLVGQRDLVLAQETSKSPALIFYEIRGDEQETGSLSTDIDSIRDSGQPVTFLWTYNKLFDESAASLVHGLNTYRGGVLLEVDDQLRKDAGVEKDTLWPRSTRDVERTTILGYSQTDRRKLVDTLVQKYISIFGEAPRVVGSRIIDTPTANYLKETYGIRFQIIDEEYKDKDHSMLDGGPSLVPYPASANWLLVPDHANPDPVWVMRRPQQDLDYSLLGGDSITPIFIFSNTSSAKDTSKTANTPLYSLSPVLESRRSHDPADIPTLYPYDISLISYGDVHATLYEVTTPVYRMRILRKKSDMWITDTRLYDKSLIDPYTSRVAHYGYYMVVPYLLNETGWKDGKITYLSNPDHLTHLALPNINTKDVDGVSIGGVGDHIAYLMQYKNDDVDAKQTVIAFNKDSIQIVGFDRSTRKLPYAAYPHPLDPITESRDNISWMREEKRLFGANIDCKPDTCEITLNTQDISAYNNLFNKQSLFTFPEPELINSNSKVSLVGSARTYLVGEKVDISILSQSQTGLSVVPSTTARISTSQPLTLSPWQKDSIYEPAYLAFGGKHPTEVTISLAQDDRVLSSTIRVVPNCGQNWSACIKSPKSLFSYLFR